MPAYLLHQAQPASVLAQDGRPQDPDAVQARLAEELLEEESTGATTLPIVHHGDRDLGGIDATDVANKANGFAAQ